VAVYAAATISPLLPGEGQGVRAGVSMLPTHTTPGIEEALPEGSSIGLLLTTMTSADGTVTYTYDALGQLLGATYTGSQASETYSYDLNGNRTNTGYVTGADNRLLSDGTYYYAYDDEGNRTARFIDVNEDGVLDSGDTNITEYTWDARNRLTEVVDRAVYGGTSTQLVDYLYDVENRWIGENIDSNGDGTIDHETRFVYDGNQIVLQFDKDVSGATPLTGADLSHRYTWRADAVDQLMADEQVTTPSAAGNVVWPLADQLGTVRDLATCNAGVTSVANHRVYDSFGKLESQTNAAVDCLFGFTGRAYDTYTKLQDNWHRKYDPATGRWMSKDPDGFTAGDTNTSRYCGNCPTVFTDSSGLQVYKMVAPRGVYTEYFYAANDADAAAEAKDAMCTLVPLSAAEASLVPHCQGIVQAEKELAAVLTAANNAHHGYGKGGACGTWVTNICKLLSPTFPAQKTRLKATPVWFRQGSPSVGSGYAMVFNAGLNWLLDWVGAGNGSGYDPTNADWAPGHYALRVVFPDGYVVYFDNGWAGTGGTFSYHPGAIKPPGPPLRDEIPTVPGEPGWPK